MNLMRHPKKYDAILVAGEGKASYRVYGQHKAYLKIEGKCIFQYVLEALQQVESVRDIYMVGQEDRLCEALEAGGVDLNDPKRIRVVPQKSNLYENIWHTFLQTIPGGESMTQEELEQSPYRDTAILVAPCDSPLLTPHEAEYFITQSDLDHYDYVLGLTAARNLEYFYPREDRPGIKMAYLHLREKSYRINNLHLVKPIRIRNRHYIQSMYQYRYQRNFKNFVLLGLSLFGKDKAQKFRYYLGLQLCLLFASLGWDRGVDFFRTWTPKSHLESSISTILKTRFMALESPFPGAALDIDNGRDYEAMKTRFKEWREYLSHPEQPLTLSS